MRRSGGPDDSSVSLAASRWPGEGQAGSCVPACAGAVLGLASTSRQRLRTGLPLVGWPTVLGLGALLGEHSLSLFLILFLFSIYLICFELVKILTHFVKS